MSSTTLAKVALCQDTVDYESLLASLSIAKELLDCDTSGNVLDGAAVQIFEKLFNQVELDMNGDPVLPSTKPNVWYKPVNLEDGLTADLTCFTDLELYYYDKVCSFNKCPFKPAKAAGCVAIAYGVVNAAMASFGYDEITSETTFKDVAGTFAAYLSNNGSLYSILGAKLDVVLNVINAFCDVLIQRISAKRYLRKVALLVSECDL